MQEAILAGGAQLTRTHVRADFEFCKRKKNMWPVIKEGISEISFLCWSRSFKEVRAQKSSCFLVAWEY